MGNRWQKRRAEKENKKQRKKEPEEKKRIADNPTYREPKESMDAMRKLIEFQKVFPDFFDSVQGFDPGKYEGELNKLQQELIELSSTPDQFNDLFAEHGWIAYESMEVTLMKNAINAAREKGIEEAENILANRVDKEYIARLFLQIKWRPVFGKRMRLLELAKVDYLEGRYHACTPLLLALIDGIVDEYTGHVGFFAEKSDVTSFDSLAGHETGLQSIKKIFNETRKKINEDPITVPYRNGILHGKELAFDNKLVAAKCWTLLAALRDWIQSVEYPKKIKEKKSWSETLKGLAEHNKNKEEFERQFQEYASRDVNQIYEFPIEYEHLHLVEDATAEKFTVDFFEALKRKQYGMLVKMLDVPSSSNPKYVAGQLAKDFSQIDVISFKIVSIDDMAPAVSEVLVNVDYHLNGEVYVKEFGVMLNYLGENCEPYVRNDPRGMWVILQSTINPLRYGPHELKG